MVLVSIKQKMGWLSRKLQGERLAICILPEISLFPIDFRTFLGYISTLKSGKMVPESVEIIRNRIREVCLRCGRRPEDVLLLGVSKTFGIDKIREAVSAGLFDIGENYIQELDGKRSRLNDDRVRWHFIGHLQSNKVKYIADYIHLIHSVDNDRVAEEIQKRAEKAKRSIDVLVEVHTTDEATKFGVRPENTLELVKRISSFDRVKVRGLMTLGPFSEDPEDSRPSFRQLADLAKRITNEGIDDVALQHLSMGMSHDFGVAIEEGATIVRIGTGIFGERPAAA
jgi:pyridoxal phosphate enzyme (YggS family)